MPIPDKLAAAKKINEFLQTVVTHGGLHLKYRITVDPPLPENRDWERPEILVDLAGPDSTLLLDRGGELLRALELLALEMLRLSSGEHEKISFDCQNHRSIRLEELRTAASVAAEKVRHTGTPYEFAPMSSRERRIVRRHAPLRSRLPRRLQTSRRQTRETNHPLKQMWRGRLARVMANRRAIHLSYRTKPRGIARRS